MQKNKRYPLQPTQLARICQFHAQLIEVVSLSALFPEKSASVEEALACGALLVHGTLEMPEQTRWLPVEHRRSAAFAAKALHRQQLVLRHYRRKGFEVRKTDWRYEERREVAGTSLYFSTRSPLENVYPSHASLRKALAAARKKVRLLESKIDAALNSVSAGLSQLALQYPGVVNMDAELEAARTQLKMSKVKDGVEWDLTRYLHKRARELRKNGILNSPEAAELHVSSIQRPEGYIVVCLVLKMPGQKPRVTFRTAKKNLEHTIALYLRSHKSILGKCPVVIYVTHTLHDAVIAQEDFDSARMLVRQPSDRRVKQMVTRYCDHWEKLIPRDTRLKLGARPAKPIGHTKALVYTDASQHPSGNGIASIFYLRGRKQPVILARQTPEAETPVLEARALLMGMEALERENPQHTAKFLTDNEGVVFALEAFRDTGVMGKMLTDALGHRSKEWLAQQVARHRFAWIPAHSGIEGNEMADRYARVGRTAPGPLWV